MKPRLSIGPELAFANRQRKIRLPVATLRRRAQAAVPLCLAAPGSGERPLVSFAEVAVVLVSDRVIARVHDDFSGVPRATDVITFQHGELIVSVEMAARLSRETGEPFLRELLRYVVHGLLHLNGHLDDTPSHRNRMWRVQEAVIKRVHPLKRAELGDSIPE